MRHLQNLDLDWDSEKLAASFSTLHQGHSLKVRSDLRLEPLMGTIELEDEEHALLEDERPMTISWKFDPDIGICLHSIEGTFGGIEAAFHEEIAQETGSLIGSARIAFGPISELIPQRIGKVFQELKMGKGYEVKGRLGYDRKDLSSLSFKGLLSGKACELFGFQVRTLLTQVEADAKRVRLFEFKASDSAGILKTPEVLMYEANEVWQIAIPKLTLQEFRPSLLQKMGHDVGAVGPFVIRELKINDFKGLLEESRTYTAKGELSFINSFKREHTVFDLPSDFLGRIFGLDLELLIPVVGHLNFDLKEDRFWLKDLSDAYSEGKRSKFFLVKEGLSPSVDLDGNLNILIKMKQYVLFKFTEHFLLSIDGSLDKPSYRLQKKSRFLGS